MPVGALGVDDGDVGPDRPHGQQRRAAEGIVLGADPGVVADDVAPDSGERGQVGHAHGGRLEPQADREIAVLLDGDGMGYALLERTPEAVTGASGHVADPGRDHAGHAAGADQLVEGHVGDRTDQGEIPTPLTDQLVDRREGDARFQRQSQRDRVAVVDMGCDRVPQ